MKIPKVICLMPVKNEADLLPITLPILSQYCDFIIIADQMSTDGSREIYKNFSKVRVIDNLRSRQTNQIRWDLLKEARRYGENNLIICLDADEYIPPDLFKKFLNEYDFTIGESFRFPWIQLWKSIDFYNNSGVWYRNYQRIAWVDDGKNNYENKIDVIDDLPRVPKYFLSNCKRIDSVPVIHLQWVLWNKTQVKQCLYKCLQLVHGQKKPSKINSDYIHSLEIKKTKLIKSPNEWVGVLNKFILNENEKQPWQLFEIYKLFEKYGVEFFEPLQIWHIEELRNKFIKRTGRDPISKTENFFISSLKDFKRNIIKIFRY